MRKILCIFFGIGFYWVSSQAQLPKAYRITGGVNSSPGSNSINDILVRHNSVWLGTESGLSLTTDGGINWTNFSNTAGKGISAIAIDSSTIWIAKGYSTELNGESIQTGGGLQYSTDQGLNWISLPQPIDHGTIDTLIYAPGSDTIRALDITVSQQNITFDIALTKNTVWIASWAGMLRKSTDLGSTWTRVILPPDSLNSIKPTDSLNYAFDLSPASGRLGLRANNNHMAFSIYASDDTTIWVGTAGGINKSTDAGISWHKFNHLNRSISGNFVVALREQIYNNRRIMWAATVNANDPDEIKGVSYTDDAGETWKTTLLGEWAHNIAVNDAGNVVYIGTDNGLFRSSDFGASWIKNGSIYDSNPLKLQRFVSTECYGVCVKGDTVWFGGPEGIAYTIDSLPPKQFGSAWHIFRTAEQVGDKNFTYAFPNPFAPNNEPVRLHYRAGAAYSGTHEISIRIFDYAMLPVRTLIQKAPRLSGKEYDEIWNGRNDNNAIVANGVYFYRVEIDDQSPLWGKILVLR